MDWYMVTPAVIALVGFPTVWCLLAGFSIKNAREGYMVFGAVLTALAIVLGIAMHESNAIGWGILGIASVAFGYWGVPGLRALFSGKYDHQVNALFRE